MSARTIDAAARLRDARVRDVMTAEIVTCTADVPLAEVADLMVGHRIHSVIVLAPPVPDPLATDLQWSVLSDLDLVAAVPWGEPGAGAGTIAASPRTVVRADDSLAAAALAMAENATAHVLVVEGDGSEPVGILSALDVARALAPETTAPAEPAAAEGRVRPGDRLVITAHHQGGRPRDA
ncbi:MAG TPA: CBS domain-containing protein [Miltoncostaea sp.]|nr:CBS domain-containing protein [Miltoncostaea sp.]